MWCPIGPVHHKDAGVVGAEGLRLLRRLGSVQHRAALRAVVRGFRILEDAFGAVDVTHLLRLRRRLAGEDITHRGLG